MWQVRGDKVVGSIQEKNRTPDRDALLSQGEQTLHHRKGKSALDSLLVNSLSRGFPERVLGERLSERLRKGSTAFFGHCFGVIETLWPGDNIRSPHHESRHDWTRQWASSHLIAADHAREALRYQLMLQLKCWFYSRNGTASFTVTPMNVSG